MATRINAARVVLDPRIEGGAISALGGGVLFGIIDATLFPLKLGGGVGFEAVNRNGPFGGAVAHLDALIIRAYRIGLFQFRRDAEWIFAVFEEEAILAIRDGPARR